MSKNPPSLLVVGFNTRPLAESLNKAGYAVYAVDFFGDLDLYPNVKDSLIIIKNLRTNYVLIKDNYKEFLAKLTIDMLQKHPNITYLLIGSGLDDAFFERASILAQIRKQNSSIISLDNDLDTIKKARNAELLYNLLSTHGYKTPLTYAYDLINKKGFKFDYPFVMKKKSGSGGVNVYKIENENKFNFFLTLMELKKFIPSEWLLQEYIEGIPISCTIIANGDDCEVISINRQIIGLKFLNAPKDFMYCGNTVPANLTEKDNQLISEIAVFLTKQLRLKGINGFDFVLKNHYPYLMEINPRIPGSISASETALNINFLDLHVRSFNPSEWPHIKSAIKSSKPESFSTKLIFYAPKEIDVELIKKINRLEYIHDKSETYKNILQNEPVCTVLYKGKDFSESYFGALKIVDKIKEIIQ